MDQEYDAKAADNPHYMAGSNKGARVYVYVEGNTLDGPKMILVHPKIIRNHGVLLDRCSEKVGYPVRHLSTPKRGTKITTPEELGDEKYYIACRGPRFEQLAYNNTKTKPPFTVHTSGSPRNLSVPFKSDIQPSKHFADVKSRFSDTTKFECFRIHLAQNGRIKDGCKPFTVLPSIDTIERIKNRIHSEKGLHCERLVDALTGNKINKVEDLRPSQMCVVIPTASKQFIQGKYSIHEERNLQASRYRPGGLYGFLWQQPNNQRKGFSYPQRPRTLQPIEHTNASPHSSVASHPQTRKREAKNERTGGIQTRPVKHNHNSEKDVRGGGYSDRDNGVFKAKNPSQHTKGAKEVRDTRDTRVDLPIDQIAAEEVEESPRYDGNRTDRQPAKAKRGTNSQTVTNSKKVTNTGTRKETTHKTNSKTNPTPKAADHSHGGGKQPDQQKTKHSGTRGDFNNVSPLPPISKPNNEKQSPAKDVSGKSQMQKESEAATTIQANYKGYKTRQELEKQKDQMKAKDASVSKTDNKPETKKKEEEDKMKKVDDPKKKGDDFTKEENQAATKIQAGFRGHQTRKELAKQKGDTAKVNKQSNKSQNSKGSYNEEEMAATRIQANYRGYQTRKSMNKNKNNTKTQNNKEMDENSAATKIQANYRGHRARQDLKQKQEQVEEDKAATKIQANFRGHKARKDIKQQKEETEAATKIQATFRGHQTRKELKNQKQKQS